MLRRLAFCYTFALLFVPSLFGQIPTVTKVWFTDTSHSVTLVHFNSGGRWNFLRIRYIPSPGSCTSGRGGSLEVTGYGPGMATLTDDMRQPLGGLLPNTQYQVCPEISTDGQRWSSGAGETFTTLPLPKQHPAVPIPPAMFETSYPNTSGYKSVTIASDCHDLKGAFDTALANQIANGTIINIPPGTVCSGQYYLSQRAADVRTFATSAVNTTNSTITLPTHGYQEGQRLIFGTHYGCLPGSITSNRPNCGQGGPLFSGWIYYAHVLDANTIQVYSGAARASGGKLAAFADVGAGTMMVVKWPRPLHWIIVRTATPDSQFVPEHTRLQGSIVNGRPTPPTAWIPKMATLQMPNTYRGVASDNTLFSVSDQDGNMMSMNANIRFVGIQFTYERSEEDGVSSNPVPHFQLVSTSQWNQNIIFDRCYFHALPPPDRVARAFWWNGTNQAIVDSYIDNMQFYHPAYSGLAIKQTSKNQFTIAPGTYHHGAGSVKLTNAVSVTTTGSSGPGNSGGFVYFSMDGQLKVALPPGMRGTCSGYSRCDVFSGSIPGDGKPANGVYNLSADTLAFPNNSNGAAANYLVDPVTSAQSNCGDKAALFGDYPITPGVLTPFGGAGGHPANFGVRFSTDNSRFACGIRFYKNPADPSKTHSVGLWDSSGKLIARANSARETSSGWQEVIFANPVALSPSAIYTASVLTQAGYYITNFFINQQFDHAALHAPAAYTNTNGSCNYSDSWPKDFVGNVAGAQVACISFNNGTIAGVRNADSATNPYNTEGCQCMVGGIGPGPYAFINNYVEGSGVVWHHDDSGGLWAARGDYYYYRNYFHVPLRQMYGGSQSDGLLYFHRQALEWKAGQRILIDGNVFDGAWTETTPFGEFIDFSNPQGDVDIRNNTFKHGASVLFSPSTITGGGVKWALPIRFRFQNNLAWDINGFTYCTYGQGFCARDGSFGVIFASSQGTEDWTVDHNTFLANTGKEPGILWMSETRVEGISFTNNVFHLSPGRGEGISAGSVLGLKGEKCGDLYGKAAADCALQNYVFENNLLTGTESRGEIRSWWPGLNNYVPPKPSDLSQVGAFVRDPVAGDQFRPQTGRCQGCGNPEKDLKNFGVDIDVLEAAQGKVTAVDVPASSITSSSAVVKFTAPDQFGCPVDYSNSDPSLIKSFQRVSDRGGERARAITLSGLASGSVYNYRINCAVQQPTGHFQTR